MRILKPDAPGRLADRLRASLSGHHPFFELDDIRAALAASGTPTVDPQHADDVGETLVALASDDFADARCRVDSLPSGARDALIRLYFDLLDHSREVRARVH